MLLPVHSSINAPLSVVPKEPYYAFAPFEGIVKTLHVKPGQLVEKGDIIFSYDSRIIENKRDEALRGVAVAKAELIRLEGASYIDMEALSKIPEQRIIVAHKESEAEFLNQQVELCNVKSGAKGFVILDDPDALIGTFLQAGQLVMRIADPDQTKLKIMTPIRDAGLLLESAKVDVRLDSQPLKVHKAFIERIGYDVVISEESMPSVVVYALWQDNSAPVMPGQRGTAKIKGPKTFLGLQLFRKPIISIKSFLGI